MLEQVFSHAGVEVPAALSDWDSRVGSWYDDYENAAADAYLSEINLGAAVFTFDHTFERVVLAYAVSTPQLTARDASRIRGFPNVNESVRAALGDMAFTVDKGHYLGHASGGVLDINLFPHRRDLNRGWSSDGKRFREMERYVAKYPGTFFYHRPTYDDDTWIPASLEYGVLVDNQTWWAGTFRNKPAGTSG
jgi:hypothetical protein